MPAIADKIGFGTVSKPKPKPKPKPPTYTKPSGVAVIGGDILAPSTIPAATLSMLTPPAAPVVAPPPPPAALAAPPAPGGVVVSAAPTPDPVDGGDATVDDPIVGDDPLVDFSALELAEKEAYEATLAAIAAKYGLTRDQLLADEGEAGREYRMAMAGLQRNFARAMDQTMDSLSERGMLRSGETRRETARLLRERAEAEGESTAARDARLARVAAQEAQLASQQAAEEARQKAEYEAMLKDLELAKSK